MQAGRPTFLMLMAGAVLAAAENQSVADAPEIVWRRSLDEAAREAQELNRPLLVRFTASWCTHCSRMKWRTFSDERIAAEIGRSFVPVEIDADTNEAALERLNVKLLPTTLVLTADLREIARITGYKTAEELGPEFARVGATPDGARRAPALIEPAGGRALVPATEEAASSDPGAPQPQEFAFGGYCLVSMFENEVLAPGLDTCVATYRGKRVKFASPEHKQRFEQNPERYWPALDGLCPVSALDDHVRREGNPELAIVYRRRLWMFADEEREERFFTAAAEYHQRLRQ